MFWRFHVNSGQIYIVYVFLLSIAWFFLNQPSKFTNIFSGLFVGITVSLRPSFILFFIPFLICQRYSFLLGGLLGLLISISLSFTVASVFIWKKYILTMLKMTGIIDLKTYLPPEARTLPGTDIIYPKMIEGFDPTVRNPLEYYLDNTSLYDVLNALDIPNKRDILLIGFVITLVFFSLYVFKYSWKNKNMAHLFLLGSLICLIGDFFIPVGRYSYYDVQMILPLLIIISQTDAKDLIGNKIVFIFLSGILLSVVGFLVIPRALFFSVFLIMLYIIITSLIILQRSNKSENKGNAAQV